MPYSANTDPDLLDWLRWASESSEAPSFIKAIAESGIPRGLAELRPAATRAFRTEAAETLHFLNVLLGFQLGVLLRRRK